MNSKHVYSQETTDEDCKNCCENAVLHDGDRWNRKK